MRATVGVLGDRVVGVQVERDDQRAGAVGRRQRQGLPPASAEAQSGVLELRLWRGERHREFAEDLSVRVQRVSGGTPRFVGERRPTHGCSNDGASSTRKAMSMFMWWFFSWGEC